MSFNDQSYLKRKQPSSQRNSQWIAPLFVQNASGIVMSPLQAPYFTHFSSRNVVAHRMLKEPIMIKTSPTHLKRYKDVAMLFYRYGDSSVVQQAGFAADLSDEDMSSSGKADELASDLERLGPTFVKIGQLLSTRPDLLPPNYLASLSRLQDDCEPLPFDRVREVFEKELGVNIKKAFAHIDEKPLASASLGQVHRATLHGGREVAVKVQRPGVRQQVTEDLGALQELAEFLDSHTDFGKKYRTTSLVKSFRESLMRELNYEQEASQLMELRGNLSSFSRLKIPDVITDYTSTRVLVMDFLPGTKITALSGAVMADVDGDQLADELFHAYLKQILVDGFFHADPHPGNLLLTQEREIAILDLGMVGRIPRSSRDHLFHLLVGIADGDGVQATRAALALGRGTEDSVDTDELTRRVEDIVGGTRGTSLAKLNMGEIVMSVTKACADCGLLIPSEINLLGKTMLNLDRVGAALCPDFDPQKAIQRHMQSIGAAKTAETLTSSNFMGLLTDSKEFIEQLPSRMNRIFDMVADNRLRFKVDAIDEATLMQGLQKIANRITLGLILAALIVGSAMLAKIETSFTLMGYPGIAIIFFLVAGVGAIALLGRILIHDR